MKIKVIALSVVVFAILLTNCQKVKDVVNEYTKFELPYTAHITLPNTVGVNIPYDVTTPAIPSLLDEKLSSNNSNEELIEKITLKAFTLTLQEPVGADFAFLNSVEVSMIADSYTEKIAWLDQMPANPDSVLDLETTSTDVRELLKKENFKLKVTLVNNQGLTESHKLEINSVFEVDAQLLD